MSTNPIRSIRKKKSSLSEVKIAVLGASEVGKTALTVRFLTKRYIGEYDHQTENRYKSEVLVDGEPVIFEILDTCPKVDGKLPNDETINWADGLVLVYSITDRNSFNYTRELRQYVRSLRSPTNGGNGAGACSNCCPVMVVANKADLVHLRQVSTEEGEILAKSLDDSFVELAASEQVSQVAEAFCDLCREVHAFRRRSKQSLLDRMLSGSKSLTRSESSKK